MITILRVDDKLLHGQVAFSWVRNLKIHTIVIADDAIVYDEFMKMTLGLSKPSGVKLQILEIEEAIAFLKLHIQSENRIMAIVNSIDNAYRIMDKIPDIHSLNLGALRERYDAIVISENISLSEKEIMLCKYMMEKGKDIEMRMRFEDESLHIAELINE